MTLTRETSIIITTAKISKKNIPAIIEGMGVKIIQFRQDMECGWVRLEDADGTRKWFYVMSPVEAELLTGYTL